MTVVLDASIKEETQEETWTRILFDADKLYAPISCYEVGKMGCTKIVGKFHGKDSAGLDMYRYIVHFDNGKSTEIVNTFSVIE
jgi:hypothetical protein